MYYLQTTEQHLAHHTVLTAGGIFQDATTGFPTHMLFLQCGIYIPPIKKWGRGGIYVPFSLIWMGL